MSERVTFKDAERAFLRLCEAKGKTLAREYPIHDPAREGTWELDYNPTYGGIVIQEIVADSPPRDGDDRPQAYTAVTCPMGYERRTPREFVAMVEFALRAGVQRSEYRGGSHLPPHLR